MGKSDFLVIGTNGMVHLNELPFNFKKLDPSNLKENNVPLIDPLHVKIDMGDGNVVKGKIYWGGYTTFVDKNKEIKSINVYPKKKAKQIVGNYSFVNGESCLYFKASDEDVDISVEYIYSDDCPEFNTKFKIHAY